jgi:hypothetical protein
MRTREDRGTSKDKQTEKERKESQEDKKKKKIYPEEESRAIEDIKRAKLRGNRRFIQTFSVIDKSGQEEDR